MGRRYRENEYIVVQWKHRNVEQITHNAVHELIGVMHTRGATSAIIVTSGESPSATVAARRTTQCNGSRHVAPTPSSTTYESDLPVAVISKAERTTELKEWDRQNAESMKILGKTKPEL